MPDYSKTRIQLRRGTAADLAAANPTLGVGEPAFETDTNVLKIGDGSTTYSSLSAISGGGGGGGSLDNVVEDTTPQLGGNLDLNSKDITGTGSIDITGSGTFAYADGTCGLMVQDTGGAGIHIGDCALGSVDTYAGIKHSNHGTSDYMMISNGITTFLSAVNNGAVIIRGGGNDSASEIQVKDVGNGVAGIVFNEGGADRDIRMEGDTEQNLFYVDASTNSIGIGTATPVSTLDVNGTLTATALVKSGGTSSQFLKADGSVDSNTYVTSSISNVVEDTSPQLGGDLDTNGNNVTGTGSINISGTITTTGATASIADERLKILASETVLNEAGASVDFRVEGDTDVNLLFVDASADRVGVGTSSPSSTLHVNGTMTATTVAKTGGASTEFLKADGSVDTNTYLTAVSNIDTTNFNSSNLIAESDSIASNNNDTTIPTSAAVKAYADTKLASDTSSIANSVAVNNVVLISQSNYNALGSYDANTLYFIT
jgi:hypothetical protein